MKKINMFMIFILCLFLNFNLADAETIKMGIFEIAPHIFMEQGKDKPQGASIKYFESVASQMGYDVKWIGPLPFPRLIKNLKQGTVDGSLIMSKNNDREKFMYYPDNPYLLTYSIFAVKKENKLDNITSAEDVKGYRIGFIKGAHQSGFLKNNIKKFKMEYIPGKNWAEQNLNKLLKGRLDAVYDLNSTTLPFEARVLKIQNKIKILHLPEPPGAVYVVFSKKSPKGKLLLDKYNKTVLGIKPDYDNYLNEFIK